jgi:hypothetical protein
VIKWLSHETYRDERGWKKERARKYDDSAIEQRICDLKRHRVEHCCFVGDEYVQMDYAKKYPNEPLQPSLWYINQVVRRAGLQTRVPRSKRKGGSVYLLFPAESIKRLGYIHQSADFIGKKFITDRTEPITIFSTSYYAPFKLYQIKRIQAEKTIFAIEQLQHQWVRYPIPNVLRLDNAVQFRGNGINKRKLSSFILFLLNLGITPLFGSPSKPWTNPHIEGHNRVFTEKVWSKNIFNSLEQIDQENERFNSESSEYFKYKYARLIARSRCRYIRSNKQIITDSLLTRKNKKIYFVRFVESIDNDAVISVMNEMVHLSDKFIHQFVFGEWNLENERLSIYSEFDKKVSLIDKVVFKIEL